jgi:NADH:ubiquinone oxidoreductase subunit 5 (subunit L)/multisubunit Na+/H+ antiporter MnhA subunit
MILPLELLGWLVFVVPVAGALLTPVFGKIHPTLREGMAVLIGFITAFLALDMVLDMLISPTSIDNNLVTWVIAAGIEVEFGVPLQRRIHDWP